ncbi:HD domain-containing protein [Lachnospiraceae bacterium 45-P1]
MSFYDLFEEEPFKEVFKEVEAFTSRKLKNYNAHLESIKLSSRNKEIFDAVWGNIEFSAGEIYILDSPLLQRLRKIKQLGLAYFVYCGSDYSRFYHTTGVVFLADKMATSLNKCNINSKRDQDYFKAVVRLAAIFHDAGHMFLSHVSEHYFGKSPLYPRHEIISEMLEEFERRARKSISLHELLSCMIVNTPEVKRLLEVVGKRLEGVPIDSDESLESLVEYISGLIAGVPVDRNVLPYSSIINGPIDADKCDYLSRDSHVTRVPVAVDISRLTQKLSVVETKEINTSDLWHMDSDSSKPFYELAIADSAEKALFQLSIARTIMFDSVYYHHKVLTAETELRGLLNELSNLQEPVFSSFSEILEYTDNDFSRYFFEQLMSSRTRADIEKIQKVQREWDDILSRNMAKRIACIMPEFLLGTQSAKEHLFDDVLTNLNSDAERSLLKHLREQYEEINLLLGNAEASKEENNILIIQPPNILYGHSKIQVPINLYNGKKREFRGYELVSSRETSSSASYFVTNAENKHLMYLALEKVLYSRYHVLLKDECAACGKFGQADARKYYTQLLNKGYYDDTPELVRDSILYQYIQENQIQQVKEKFSTYEGPNGYLVGAEEIRYFFKQIICACEKKTKARKLVQGIYRLLMAATFLDRNFIVHNLTMMLQREAIKDKEILLLPLGGPGDSGKHLMYYFNDVRLDKTNIIIKENLPEILDDEERMTVVFFDDGSYSGKQLLSIMQEYMGVPALERATSEHHVETLEPKYRDRLKAMTVIYCYLMFNPENQLNTEKALHELGIENVTFLYAESMAGCLLEKTDIFESAEQLLLVKNFLENVGYDIIVSQKKQNGCFSENWNEERARNSALGYNNSQQMVFLKDSVPTYTITPFWFEGTYREMQWRPLFKRTIKD